MSVSTFEYTIHVATTREKLWETMTNPEALRATWGEITSDWVSSATVVEVDGSGSVLWKGEVLRSEAPHLLSFTFDVTGAHEPPTEVTFTLSPPATEVAPNKTVVQLTVTQTGFRQNSAVFDGCARAWPEILSSLKTYVETGRPLGWVWKH